MWSFKLLAPLLCVLSVQSTKFYVIKEWKLINFTWPSYGLYENSIQTGNYIPENTFISGVKFHKDHYYLTLPRMKSGVPATLARISASANSSASPLLEPFPSWTLNDHNAHCENLQNVQNIEIDSKGFMWIIDGGRVETFDKSTQGKCSPKLIIFDIDSNVTRSVYEFPESVASKNGSFLYDLVVDDSEGGFAYITDNSALNPGIIVYSAKDNRSWKLSKSRTFHADPSAASFTVNGIAITNPINIAGIALGPKIKTSNDKIKVSDDRDVYFSPLTSLHLFTINTTVLKNEASIRVDLDENKDIKDVGLKPSQSVSMTMDNQGILYYSLVGNNAIGRWDSHTSFETNQKIIARDDKYVEWASSFTFVEGTGNLTVVVNRLDKLIFDKINPEEANFRLITANVGGKSYVHSEATSQEPTPEPTYTEKSVTTSTTSVTTSTGSPPKVSASSQKSSDTASPSSGVAIVTNLVVVLFTIISLRLM